MFLVTAAEMRELDARATREFGIPSLLLMENAGRAVAEHTLRLLPPGRRRVAIYCGRGNNGGDGLVAARHLANAGCEVTVFTVPEIDRMRGDAAVNLEIVRRMRLPLRELKAVPRTPARAEMVIDAVLGTGIRGEVTGSPAVLIEAIRRAEAPVLAVDVPSGLDSDTGRLAVVSVRADHTVTLALPKRGLALYPGREAAGDLTVASIGMPLALLEGPHLRTLWTDRETVARRLSPRPPTAHKGSAGRVFMVAGSEGMAGAAALAAGGALRGGAGLVTLGCPRRLLPVLAAKLTEAMTFSLAETDAGSVDLDALPAIRQQAEGAGALAIGPGLGRHPRTGEMVRALLGDWKQPAVVDADALFALSPEATGPGSAGIPAPKSGKAPMRAGMPALPGKAVLTPHPGELARLLGTTTGEVEADRLAAVRSAAACFRCVVLLKGAATLIAHPDGRLAVNATGTPAMATGGCGDVLTGLLAALLAGGLEAFDAALAGAYLHGLAGELAEAQAGGIGMLAGDLMEQLPHARTMVA